MAKSEWSFKSAVELSAALTAKKVSAVELTQDAIDRIERHDSKVNAICVRDFDRALDAAREADAALARGERKPLLGLPITVKESYNIAGLPTTWGWTPQKDFKPAEDALSIARVKEAGGVILGKTNVPVGLADWQSYNEIYGTTNNPFDLGRTPGGSSGGSSAALAAGYGPLSLGSDIGGSLRVPAFHCGVYAHKPTYNLCPTRGHTPPPFPAIPMERDMAVIGPMARSAVDLPLLLDVMAGPDPLDLGIGYKLALPEARHRALKDFRVLVIDSHPLLPANADIRGAIEKLAGAIDGHGRARRARKSAVSGLHGGFSPLHAHADELPRRLPSAGQSRARACRCSAALTRRQESRCRTAAWYHQHASGLGIRRGRPRRPARAMAAIVQDIRCGDLSDHAHAGLSA